MATRFCNRSVGKASASAALLDFHDTAGRLPAAGQPAFTILELMAALGLLGLLLAAALPMYSNWITSYRLRQAAREVFSHFQLAKLSAVRRNTLCAVTFGQSVAGTAYDYVLYLDADNDLEYDAGETLLVQVVFAKSTPGIGLDSSRGGGDGLTFSANDEGRPSIAFRPSGLTANNTGGFGAGTVFLRSTRNQTRQVIVSAAGNIRIQ